jgi:hypothetical protein
MTNSGISSHERAKHPAEYALWTAKKKQIPIPTKEFIEQVDILEDVHITMEPADFKAITVNMDSIEKFSTTAALQSTVEQLNIIIAFLGKQLEERRTIQKKHDALLEERDALLNLLEHLTEKPKTSAAGSTFRDDQEDRG